MSFFELLKKLLSIRKPANPSDLEALIASVQNDYDHAGVEILNKIFIALGFKNEEGQDNSLAVPPYQLSERYGSHYNHAVYQKLLPLCQLAYLSEQNGIAEEHAFKLATIFDKAQAAMSYLFNRAKNIRSSKNTALANEYVVHDGCLFDLPAPDTCHFKQWQQLARTHLENPRFRELFPHAAELEQIGQLIVSSKKKKTATSAQIQLEKDRIPLINQEKRTLSLLIKQHKDLDTKPVTNLTPKELTARQEGLSALGKKIGEQRRELTKLCQGMPFHQIDMIVLQAFYESYKHSADEGHKILVDNGIMAENIARFYQLNKNKEDDFIPDVLLDGQALGYPGFYLKKLDTSSNQGAALAACLGKITHCCQYLGGVGDECVIHGIASPNGGFYVVCKGDAELPSLQDPIVAQSWVWRGQSNGLCLDSIEPAPSLKVSALPIIADLFRQLGHILCQKYNIPRVNTGAQSGITQSISLKNCYTPKEHFLDYHGYCDSGSQLPLANQTMPYLFYGQTHSILLQEIITQETELFIATLFTSREALKDNQDLKKILAFALDTQADDLLILLAERATHAKRHEEYEILLQKNKLHRDNLNQNIIDMQLIKTGVDINMLNDFGESVLHMAASEVNLALFEQLMAEHPNLNLQDYDGNTVLLHVLEKIVYEKKNEKGRRIVKRLIEAGAELDIKNNDEATPLMLAVKNNDLTLVKTLVEQGANIEIFDDDMKTAIFLAVERGFADIFDYLLKKGAKLNGTSYQKGTTLLIAAIQHYNPNIFNAILASPECDFKMLQQKNKKGENAFIYAIKSNQKNLLQELIAHPHFSAELLQKSGCFIAAAKNGFTWAVQALLARPECDFKMLQQKNIDGEDVFTLAIKDNQKNLLLELLAHPHCSAELLQKSGCFIAAAKNGFTWAVQALLNSQYGNTKLLLQVEPKNALVLAIENGFSEVALAILSSPHCTAEVLQQYQSPTIKNILMNALYANSKIEVVEAILGNPYYSSEMLQQGNEEGYSALKLASVSKNSQVTQAVFCRSQCTLEMLIQLQEDKSTDMNVTAVSLVPKLIEKLKSERNAIESKQPLKNVQNPHVFFNSNAITHEANGEQQQRRIVPGNSQDN